MTAGAESSLRHDQPDAPSAAERRLSCSTAIECGCSAYVSPDRNRRRGTRRREVSKTVRHDE